VSHRLYRPVAVAVAAAMILVLSLALSLAVQRADAQATTLDLRNFGVDPGANGIAVLHFPEGTDVTALCNGAFPQSGTSQIPAQVESRRVTPDTIQLRIFNNVGTPVGAWVRVNCLFEFVGAPASLQQVS
jgi:hypothetical protein